MKTKSEKNGIKRILVLLIVAGLTLSLANCSKEKKVSDGSGKELTTLRVNFSNLNATTVLNYLALDQGYYVEEGLNVVATPVNGNSSIDSFTALVTDKLDLVTGGSGIGTLLSIESGIDTIIIGGLQSGQGALVVRKGDEARWKDLTTENLAGRSLGTARAMTADVTFRGLLQDKGVDLSKIKFVELDSFPTAIIACAKGEVDGALIAHSNLYNAEKQGLVIVKYIGEELPNLPCCRISVTGDLLKKYRNEYVGFLKAQIRAFKLLETDREKTLEIATNALEMDTDRIAKYVYDFGYLSLSPDPAIARMRKMYSIASGIGYLKGDKSLDEHFDTTVYEDALNQIIKEYPADPFYQKMKQDFIRDNV
jgi:NitT/TauT family transport system substrate-binding protein